MQHSRLWLLALVPLVCATTVLAQAEPCCDPNARPGVLGNPLCPGDATCCDDGLWRCDLASGESACPGDVGEECVQLCGGGARSASCDLPDRFCRFEEGRCGEGSGICTQIPDACLEYQPVCGCDDENYVSECEAFAAGVSIKNQGACGGDCGGFIGGGCSEEDHYCRLLYDGCCCDLSGSCSPVPTACPDTCDLVCGCGGETYLNECTLAAAGRSRAHPGQCGTVPLVEFVSSETMRWEHAQFGGTTYRVYRKIVEERPLTDFGDCYAIVLPSTQLSVPDPPAGDLWLFMVTAWTTWGGEGPLGVGSDCSPRVPAEPCLPN